MRRRSALAALPAALLLYGCAGNGPPPSSGGSAYDVIQQEIFNQHCLSAGCHNSLNQAGNLNLTAGASYGDLVNVVPENPLAAANGLLRVTPFDPNNSFLIVKLEGPPPGEGHLSGKTFVLTGTLPDLTREQATERMKVLPAKEETVLEINPDGIMPLAVTLQRVATTR